MPLNVVGVLIAVIFWLLFLVSVHLKKAAKAHLAVLSDEGSDRWGLKFAKMFLTAFGSYQSPYHYILEDLPIIMDQCGNCNASHVYLLRVLYGGRNKKFFMPNAQIEIKFYDKHNEIVANYVLAPKMLLDNHRRYLPKAYMDKPKFFYVMIKRKKPLKDITMMAINHNQKGGVIWIYNLILQNLNKPPFLVYGSNVNQWIECIGPECSLEPQQFSFVCFGQCSDSFKYEFNLNAKRTSLLVFTGLNTIILIPSWLVVRYPYSFLDSLSKPFWLAIVWTMFIFWISLSIIIIQRYVCESLGNMLQFSGIIWALKKMLDWVLLLYFIIKDYYVITLNLYFPIDTYWCIFIGTSAFLHLFYSILLIQLFYVMGLYDRKPIKHISVDDRQFQLLPMAADRNSNNEAQPVDRPTLRNLYIPSIMQPIINVRSIEKLLTKYDSISKIIENIYASDLNMQPSFQKWMKNNHKEKKINLNLLTNAESESFKNSHRI